MKKFIHIALKMKGLYIISLIGLVLGIAFDAAVPCIVGETVDEVMINGSRDKAPFFLAMIFLCLLMRGVSKYVEEFASDNISQGMTHRRCSSNTLPCRTGISSVITARETF